MNELPGDIRSMRASVPRDPHAQANDEVSSISYFEDPNLAGWTPTAQLHDPMAGPLSTWQENDCYKDFFEIESMPAPEPRQWRGHVPYDEMEREGYEPYGRDDDYDSNHGIPDLKSKGYIPGGDGGAKDWKPLSAELVGGPVNPSRPEDVFGYGKRVRAADSPRGKR